MRGIEVRNRITIGLERHSVMEKSHLNRLRRRFGEILVGKRIVTLHIPDDYRFMQPELIDELQTKVREYVAISNGSDAV